jgi:hypothetical protein
MDKVCGRIDRIRGRIREGRKALWDLQVRLQMIVIDDSG